MCRRGEGSPDNGYANLDLPKDHDCPSGRPICSQRAYYWLEANSCELDWLFEGRAYCPDVSCPDIKLVEERNNEASGTSEENFGGSRSGFGGRRSGALGPITGKNL